MKKLLITQNHYNLICSKVSKFLWGIYASSPLFIVLRFNVSFSPSFNVTLSLSIASMSVRTSTKC